MTKSLIRRVARRSRGRPPKDADDLFVRELARAHQLAWGLGPQEARDLALAWLEGVPGRPTKLPRGYRKAAAGSMLGGFLLPDATFKGREGAIAKNRRGGGVRRDVVLAWVDVLRARDEKDLLRCLKALVDALSA
jgi:hypothetical protein